MHEAGRMTPHTSNPQDVLATWHALKAHPSQMHAITEHLQQQLTHLQADKQQEMLSLADAKADLVQYLEAAAGADQSSQVMAHAVRHCMLSTADRAQVRVNSKLAPAFSFCIVLTVSCLVAGACSCVIVLCNAITALLIMFSTCTTLGSPVRQDSTHHDSRMSCWWQEAKHLRSSYSIVYHSCMCLPYCCLQSCIHHQYLFRAPYTYLTVMCGAGQY